MVALTGQLLTLEILQILGPVQVVPCAPVGHHLAAGEEGHQRLHLLLGDGVKAHRQAPPGAVVGDLPVLPLPVAALRQGKQGAEARVVHLKI